MPRLQPCRAYQDRPTLALSTLLKSMFSVVLVLSLPDSVGGSVCAVVIHRCALVRWMRGNPPPQQVSDLQQGCMGRSSEGSVDDDNCGDGGYELMLGVIQVDAVTGGCVKGGTGRFALPAGWTARTGRRSSRPCPGVEPQRAEGVCACESEKPIHGCCSLNE